MLLIALYIIFGISLIRIVILSILLYHARICARLSHDIEMSIMRLANLILHHARTPAQLSHDLEMSRTRRSSLTHLSSLTEITEGEFNRLCRSRMWSQRLQNTCLSIYHACFTLHIGHQSSGHGHTRIDWCNPSTCFIWLLKLLQCDFTVLVTHLSPGSWDLKRG